MTTTTTCNSNAEFIRPKLVTNKRY